MIGNILAGTYNLVWHVFAVKKYLRPSFDKPDDTFFRKHPIPEATRALRQALEVFRLNAELRKRVAPGLDRWLAARKEPAPSPAAKARRTG